MVCEKNKEDQTKSKTKEITIYNIRPKKGSNYPPLKIIDTPGFGDTEGIEEDQKHLEKFKNIFENKLYLVHSICYMVNSSDCRVGFHQEYIFNTILGLFAENVKKNFIVGVTHFFAKNKKQKPNIIQKSLSLENSFYYNNILKDDNLSREEILNSYWYFCSDNEIISDNSIEGNVLEKMKWNQTEEQIKFFIENKIKNSEGKKIKESTEVVKNRLDMTLEIDNLKKEMEESIETRKKYLDNKKNEENCLDEIKKKKEIIMKYKEEKRESEINKRFLDYQIFQIIYDEKNIERLANKYNEENNYIKMLDNVTEKLNESI